MEVMIDCLTVLAEIEILADQTFEDWSFDRVVATNVTLDIFENNFFFFFRQLSILLQNLQLFQFVSELTYLIIFSLYNQDRLFLFLHLLWRKMNHF